MTISFLIYLALFINFVLGIVLALTTAAEYKTDKARRGVVRFETWLMLGLTMLMFLNGWLLLIAGDNYFTGRL